MPMQQSSLGAIRLCLFDAYGTLFDVNAAARTLQDEIGPEWQRLSVLWRQKQLEYSWLRSMMGRYADFRQVTEEALSYAIEATGASVHLHPALMALYDTLNAYPEVPTILADLRNKGYKTAILSNGSPSMLASAIESAGVRELLDQALSVDSLGYYKPLPTVYQLALDAFGVSASEVLFFSSNGWDVAGAAAFGFHTVWVNRTSAPIDRLPTKPHFIVNDLSQACSLLRLS